MVTQSKNAFHDPRAHSWRAVLYADRTALYPCSRSSRRRWGFVRTGGVITSAYSCTSCESRAGWRPTAGNQTGADLMFALSGSASSASDSSETHTRCSSYSALHGLGAEPTIRAASGRCYRSPEKRGISSGFIGMGMALGILGGMAVSGPLYEFFGHYRPPFLVLAVPTVLMLFAFVRFLPDTRNAGGSPSLSVYKRLFRDRDIWKINMATFCSLYGFWAAATWGPTFLQAERGFSLSGSGLYTGLIALSALPGGVLWGRLSDRFGRRKIAALVLPASGVALFLLTRVQGTPLIVSTCCSSASSATRHSPVAVAWIGDIVSKRHPGSMSAAVGFQRDDHVLGSIAPRLRLSARHDGLPDPPSSRAPC